MSEWSEAKYSLVGLSRCRDKLGCSMRYRSDNYYSIILHYALCSFQKKKWIGEKQGIIDGNNSGLCFIKTAMSAKRKLKEKKQFSFIYQNIFNYRTCACLKWKRFYFMHRCTTAFGKIIRISFITYILCKHTLQSTNKWLQ